MTADFAHTDVANGPTQSVNPKVMNSKRTAHGSRDFGNYQTSRMRTAQPRFGGQGPETRTRVVD